MKVLAGITALAVIGGTAAIADAATNEYTVNWKTSPAKAGTPSKPVPTSFTTDFTVKDPAGLRPSPLAKTTLFHAGLRINGKAFPTCAVSRIKDAGSDSGCAKGSLVGTGTTQVVAGFTANESDQQYKCTLHIKNYNAPSMHEAIYITAAASECSGTTVNQVLDGKWTNSSKGATLVYTSPTEANHAVAGTTAATVLSHSTIKKLTTKVKGKTVGFAELIGGCKGGKRAIKFTETSEDGKTASATSGAAC